MSDTAMAEWMNHITIRRLIMGKDIKNADGFMVEYDRIEKGVILTFKGPRVWDKLSYAKSFLTNKKQFFKGNFIEGRIVPLYARPENTFVYIDGPSKPKPYSYLGDDDE